MPGGGAVDEIIQRVGGARVAVRFFGQFLIEKGCLTMEQLARAVSLQESQNHRFGELAVQMGLLSPEEVRHVIQAQRRIDLPFGETARYLGLIDESAVQKILSAQKTNRLQLGEAAVRLGFMTTEEVSRALEEFWAEEMSQTASLPALPPNLPHHAAVHALMDIVSRQIVRFVGQPVRYGPGVLAGAGAIRWDGMGCRISVTGSPNGWILLLVPVDLAARIAGQMVGLRPEELSPEMPEEGLKEFVNIVAGHWAGHDVHGEAGPDIGFPEMTTFPLLMEIASGVLVPAHTPLQSFTLGFFTIRKRA